MSFATFLYNLYIFFVGCCVGSFVNVAALRGVAGISFVKGRSACPTCGATLRGYDLIPLVSYGLLRGKCRYCGAKISPRYPAAEAVLGMAFVLCFWWYGLGLQALIACVLASLLLGVFLVDMATQTIPNGLVLCFLVPCALEFLAVGCAHMTGQLLGFFVVSVPMFLLTLLIPNCFGGGDIKLVAVCGFLLGWRAILLSVFLAIVVCGLGAILRMITKTLKPGDHIAFGPYLAVGIFVARLFGEQILRAYFSLFA